jgi:hypothetical protein
MTNSEKIALRFATALNVGDFATAHELLSQAQRAALSAFDLQKEFETMTAQGAGEKLEVEVSESLKDWPTKQGHDLGWAYVSISGQSCSEAVAVIVSNEAGRLCIRDLEWGRP